jgi:hypothetical protein
VPVEDLCVFKSEAVQARMVRALTLCQGIAVVRSIAPRSMSAKHVPIFRGDELVVLP